MSQSKLFLVALSLFATLPGITKANEPLEISNQEMNLLRSDTDRMLAYASTNSDSDLNMMLNLGHSPTTYDSIVANWESRQLNQSLEEFVKSYIILDTSTYVEAVGEITDEEYIRRLRTINSPIYLPFNEIVRKYLVAYTVTHRNTTRQMLGESKYYFPMIEEELMKAGMPLEIKFLAVVESALRPTAVSRAGAMGMWQFMLATGRQYGLEVTSLVDDRRDPQAATRAACAYLKDLYKIYNDWTLAMAAYNCGPGNLNKAIQRAGSGARTYWDIYDYLPRETRDYIPAIIGVAYAYHYYQDYDIQPYATTIPLSTDTVEIHQNLHLEQVSSTLQVPLELLRMLNPQYKEDIIPGLSKTYSLRLPQQEVCRFIEHQALIHSRDTIYLADHLTLNPRSSSATQIRSSSGSSTASSGAKTHKVVSGDTLGAIGRKYGVTITQLTRWNNISSTSTLRIGQSIKVSSP